MEEKLIKITNKVLKKAEKLDLSEQKIVSKEISKKKIKLYKDIEELYKLESLIDYQKLLKKGFSQDELKEFIKKDHEYLLTCKNKTKEYRNFSQNFFCFPTNNSIDETALIKYLRYLESTLPILNSCGDPYEESNFLLSNKETEAKIIDMVAQNSQIIKPFWGYITSGGTEGNLWGIREGKKILQKSKIYFSKAAHYGILKIAKMLYDDEDIVIIDTYQNSEKISKDLLLSKIIKDYKQGYKPNLLLTFGTTCSGDIDEFKEIASDLEKLKIPYYLHLDCAFFGGIPKASKNSPILTRENIRFINSISISFHKYYGSPLINGALLSRQRGVSNKIEYIGNIDDSTISGSRSFPAFSLFKRIEDLLTRSKENEYEVACNKFIAKLNEYKINYIRYNNSNIFILDSPNNELLKKYQLSTFSYNGKKSIHIIVTPNTNYKNLNKLLKDIQ